MFANIPDSACIIDARSGESFTRTALASAVRNRAEALLAAGIRAGDRAAVAHGSPVGVLIDLFALWRIGAVAVLLSKTLTASERANVVSAIRPSL
ncbi:MAG: AMP-binding protein, partial [Rhizobiales bacterium]|nr:AMP-binding protein [Hyphomicrobiales bacterium]